MSTPTHSKPHLPRENTERAAYRKASRRLIPFLFLLYMVAFIDRVNIGFAKLQMATDLGLSEAVYGVGAGIFFLGYFFFEIPSNIILHRVGARFWISRILLLWGLISMGMMFVDSVASFYTMRFLLGIGEAGFFPGVVLYLTYWFPSRQRAKTTASFMTAIAISGVIGGPISGWVMETLDGWLELEGWQWLFLIEGAPAVLLAFVSYRFLDDHPGNASWLTTEEKEILLQRLAEDQAHRESSLHYHSLRQAVFSRQVWRLTVIYFLLVMGTYGVSFWLPQIVHDLDRGGFLITGFLSAIPYVFAAVFMVAVAHSSDVRHERRWHIALSGLISGLGLMATAHSSGSSVNSIAGLTVATSGILAALAVFWSLPTAFLTGRAAAGGIALINSFGGLGGYFGPAVLGWVRQTTGSLEAGLYVLAAAMALASLIVVRGTTIGITHLHRD